VVGKVPVEAPPLPALLLVVGVLRVGGELVLVSVLTQFAQTLVVTTSGLAVRVVVAVAVVEAAINLTAADKEVAAVVVVVAQV
jgi:hypothetical protein